MIRFISAISKILRGRTINIDPNVSCIYLCMLSARQVIRLLRGVFFARKFIFLGVGVNIFCKKKLKTNNGVIIDDFTYVDAIGQNGINLGSGVYIGRFSYLRVSGTLSDLGKGITIGNNVGIGDYAHIGGAGGVLIGDDTIIGAYFSAHPENHNYSDLNVLIRMQGVNRKGIIVGNNCWIGAKVTLLDGCKIGNGCVVAAGSVVKGEFPDNTVIGGIPAKILKAR